MISRRGFIKTAVACAGLYPFGRASASPSSTEKISRTLNLYNTHTGEALGIEYLKSGTYVKSALSKLNHFFRCHYTNEVKRMSVSLLDLLSDITDAFGRDAAIDIISGYRSRAYNEYLRKTGGGVSRNSMHLRGLAIDFSIRGAANEPVFNIAKSFSAGGVGLYPEFVHIDVGPVRYW